MKKLLQIIILSLLIFNNASAEKRDIELQNLFKELKNSEDAKAIEIENKIWKIWITHPSEDRKGYISEVKMIFNPEEYMKNKDAKPMYADKALLKILDKDYEKKKNNS